MKARSSRRGDDFDDGLEAESDEIQAMGSMDLNDEEDGEAEVYEAGEGDAMDMDQ